MSVTSSDNLQSTERKPNSDKKTLHSQQRIKFLRYWYKIWTISNEQWNSNYWPFRHKASILPINYANLPINAIASQRMDNLTKITLLNMKCLSVEIKCFYSANCLFGHISNVCSVEHSFRSSIVSAKCPLDLVFVSYMSLGHLSFGLLSFRLIAFRP